MKKKYLLSLLLLFLLIFPAVRTFFQPGFFPSHDGEWMIVRLSDFHRSLVSGQFPVRWAARLNHQYGYPVFNFLYPLSLYFGEFFHLLGFNFINAIKAVFVASFFFSGLFMFTWLQQKWGFLAGLVGSLIYVYTPYRLVDVYVRGSLGEALAFVFPPLIFWMSERLIKRKNYLDIVIGSLAFAALLISHNTQALLFTLLFTFYLILLYRQKKSLSLLFPIFQFLILGLGLAAFFWLPALWDKKYVVFDQVLVSNFFFHFPTFKQLIFPSWGYGPSLPLSDQDQMSFQVGVLNLLIGLLSLLFWFLDKKKNPALGFFAFSFWIVFFFMLPVSYWPWRLLLIYNLIQFPWRLLSLTTLISSVLGGYLISKFKGIWRWLFLFLVIACLVPSAVIYARPEYITHQPVEFYSTNEDSTTVAAEYTPLWVKEKPQKRAEEKVEIIDGRGLIGNLQTNSKKISFQIDLDNSQNNTGRVRVNLHYFPGWRLFINEQELAISYQKNGLVEFPIPVGNSQVLLVFGETKMRLFADLLSLLSFILLIFLAYKGYSTNVCQSEA